MPDLRSLLRAFALIILVASGMTGCASKVAESSGFLADAGQLKRDKSVRTPDFEFRSAEGLPLPSGTVVYVAPVTVRLQGESKADAAIQQRVAESFTSALRTELATAFPVVSTPEASKVTVRAVVTRLKPSVPALNMPTALYPSTRLTAELQQAVTGQQGFTGAASAEIEVIRTGEGTRIYAMMDYTTGRKAIMTSGSSWAPVERLCRRWAQDLVKTLRGGKVKNRAG